jgi:hypothetical protein
MFLDQGSFSGVSLRVQEDEKRYKRNSMASVSLALVSASVSVGLQFLPRVGHVI